MGGCERIFPPISFDLSFEGNVSFYVKIDAHNSPKFKGFKGDHSMNLVESLPSQFT